MSTTAAAPFEQSRKMDRMYRFQKHFYDITRKYYLLGRDRLLERMDLRCGNRVLEIGCGTGRNLIQLHRLRPDVLLYGLDASEEMLSTARRKLAHRGMAGVPVVQALAEEFRYDRTFVLSEPFDAAYFSYTLSMIPPWREALNNALENIKPGRSLYVVDFWDQRDLPAWFRALLQRWLALFGVHHPPGMMEYLESLSASGRCRLTVESYARRYAFLARVERL